MTRDLKVGIIGGTISSALFIYFLDPIIRITLTTTGALFSGFTGWFLDTVCARAALGSVQDSALLVLWLGYSVILGFMFGAISIIVKHKFIKRAISEDPKSRDEKEQKRKNLLSLKVVMLFCLLAVLSLGYILAQTWISARYITSFQQHLNALAPTVSESQLIEWRSKWAQMESYGDYSAIYEEMRSAAKSANIKLLDNKAYSPNSF